MTSPEGLDRAGGAAAGEAGSIECTIDGVTCRVPAGATAAAALVLAQGRVGWRRTRVEGRPRGLYCGIGLCFDCLVAVDGHAGRRSCLVEVTPGMAIETSYAPECPATDPEGAGDA